MRSLLTSLISLMSASFLVHASNTAITTMIAIVIAEGAGHQSDVALIAACYSLGFVAGCFLSPSQVLRIGLIRAFAAAAATLTITIVALDLIDGVGLWAFLRFMMGASVAAVLAISDSWINDKTPNDERGKVIAVYAIVLGLAAFASQMVFLVLDAGADGFVLLFAITMNVAVVLVALTSATAPNVQREPRKSFRLLTNASMTANIGVFTAGFATASVISIVPFYLRDNGVQEEFVAMALASLYLGRVLFQWSVGLISDRFDRRSVLTGLSLGIALLMILVLLIGEGEGRLFSGAAGMAMQALAFLACLLLGGMLFPIYSVASALAFDRAEGRSMIDISTTLLVIYSIGSIAGPFTVMLAAEVIGDPALPVCILIACALFMLTGMLRRGTVEGPAKTAPVSGLIPQSSVEMVQAAAEVIEERMEETSGSARKPANTD